MQDILIFSALPVVGFFGASQCSAEAVQSNFETSVQQSGAVTSAVALDLLHTHARGANCTDDKHTGEHDNRQYQSCNMAAYSISHTLGSLLHLTDGTVGT